MIDNMIKKVVRFVGLTPGFPPWGRDPLFQIIDAANVPFRQGDVVPLPILARTGIEIPHDEKIAVQRALIDWDNSAPCDDNLFWMKW